jgi:hypothetical protein
VRAKQKKVRKNRSPSEFCEDPPTVDAESADIAPKSSFVPEYSRGQLWRERWFFLSRRISP